MNTHVAVASVAEGGGLYLLAGVTWIVGAIIFGGVSAYTNDPIRWQDWCVIIFLGAIWPLFAVIALIVWPMRFVRNALERIG